MTRSSSRHRANRSAEDKSCYWVGLETKQYHSKGSDTWCNIVSRNVATRYAISSQIHKYLIVAPTQFKSHGALCIVKAKYAHKYCNNRLFARYLELSITHQSANNWQTNNMRFYCDYDWRNLFNFCTKLQFKALEVISYLAVVIASLFMRIWSSIHSTWRWSAHRATTKICLNLQVVPSLL